MENTKEVGLPFLQGHDGGALVLEDGLVRVHANVELIAELAGLQHRSGMAWDFTCLSVTPGVP